LLVLKVGGHGERILQVADKQVHRWGVGVFPGGRDFDGRIGPLMLKKRSEEKSAVSRCRGTIEIPIPASTSVTTVDIRWA
jgi:hypothetical protein